MSLKDSPENTAPEPNHTKSGARTLLASLILSSPGPLVVGIGLFLGKSSTQLADFIRRTAELLAILVSFIIYRITHKDEAFDPARKLRLEKLANRSVGIAMCVSGLAMLLVDTDRREIHNAVQGNEATALDFRDTLLMPLRRPAHYRDESDRVLKWLSRRWLYNIPASLQTEGLRPLGRLAMVDHGPIFADRLRTILQTITSEASLAASAEATGMKVASCARYST